MGKFNELRVVIYLKLKKVAKIEIVVFIASIITDKYCRDNSSMVHTIIITVTKTDHQEYSTTKTTTIVDINREDTTAINLAISIHQSLIQFIHAATWTTKTIRDKNNTTIITTTIFKDTKNLS
ncbi:hypothetical protein BpHYR1_018393 [Brachionus plicatilis]|uniref:Uncharacterized protein n=1 Tax=Brachionus plicatilis TaxID=10195 RepID=A0A3M7P7D8_BRAPC|nr:hypothetical protein BpHYR1_018393 [Brachionus plicatilis]